MTDELWEVYDSTKLSDYDRCPRLYFYRHILGWVRGYTNWNLAFGIAWHEAIEYMTLNGYQHHEEAFQIFYDKLREAYPDPSRDPEKGKTAQNAHDALEQYAKLYESDNYEVLHTEASSSVKIDDSHKIYARLDTILKDSRGVFSFDRKTTGRFAPWWYDQWSMSLQVGTYTAFLMSKYPENPVSLIIDGTAFIGRKVDPIEFRRVNTPRPNLAQWKADVVQRIDEIREQTDETLLQHQNSIMTTFRRNPSGCFKYNTKCTFWDICLSQNNPWGDRNYIPTGFKKKQWNPAK